MSSQTGKKSRPPGTQKYLFPSHNARESAYNNVRPHTKYTTLFFFSFFFTKLFIESQSDAEKAESATGVTT